MSIHPDTELRQVSREVGYGVFATAVIPRGTITWSMDELDQVISEERFAKLLPAMQPMVEKYCYRDAQRNYVICWDFGRYMNHSCEATTASLGSLCDIAVRDIQPGEQLTCEYALHNLDETVGCRCGAARCRGVVKASELDGIASEIDRVVALLLPEIPKRAQPIIPFMRPANRKRLEAILAGREPVPSVRENR